MLCIMMDLVYQALIFFLDFFQIFDFILFSFLYIVFFYFIVSFILFKFFAPHCPNKGLIKCTSVLQMIDYLC